MVEMREPETTLRLEAPAGVVEVRAACREGKCESVELTNVPCFADRIDAPLEVDGLGSLTVDVAFGGMWYAIADAAALGFALEPSEARELSPRRRADPRGGARAAAVRPSREHGDRGRQHRPDRRAVARRRGGVAERGRRRARPARPFRQPAPGFPPGWRRCTPAGSCGRATRCRMRRAGHGVRGADRRARRGGRAPGDRPRDPRQRVDHRCHAGARRPERSIPGGLPSHRHLAGRRTCSSYWRCSGYRGSPSSGIGSHGAA